MNDTAICHVCGMTTVIYRGVDGPVRCEKHFDIPEDRSTFRPGVPVVIRDASGDQHRRIAASGVVPACWSYIRKVWIESVADADPIPWPAEDVRLDAERSAR
jgi:hypothetical protein